MLDSHALAFRCIRIRVRISAIDLRLWLHLTNSNAIDINRACHPKHDVELSWHGLSELRRDSTSRSYAATRRLIWGCSHPITVSHQSSHDHFGAFLSACWLFPINRLLYPPGHPLQPLHQQSNVEIEILCMAAITITSFSHIFAIIFATNRWTTQVPKQSWMLIVSLYWGVSEWVVESPHSQRWKNIFTTKWLFRYDDDAGVALLYLALFKALNPSASVSNSLTSPSQRNRFHLVLQFQCSCKNNAVPSECGLKCLAMGRDWQAEGGSIRFDSVGWKEEEVVVMAIVVVAFTDEKQKKCALWEI